MTRQRPPQMESSPGWDKIASFYRVLTEQYGWDQHTMLDVVAHYAGIETKPAIHASTSQAALGISTAETYPGRLVTPMVYIEYDAKGDKFRVVFQRRQGETERTEIVKDLTSVDATSEILAWLHAEWIIGEQ